MQLCMFIINKIKRITLDLYLMMKITTATFPD